MKPKKPIKQPVKKMEIKKIIPNSLAVLDKYKLLDTTASVQDQLANSYEVYKDPKKVEEVAKAIFTEAETNKIKDFGEFDITLLEDGVQRYFLQRATSSAR